MDQLPPYAWVVSAYDRDWERLGLVECLLDAAVRLGLLGEVRSLVAGDEHRPQPLSLHTGAEVPALLSAALWRQTGPKQFTAQGDRPRPWWLGVSWFRDNPQGGADPGLDAIGRLTLRFGGDWAGDRAASEALWREFRRLHDGSNTTCAWIDAWDRCLDLRDAGPPLISRATFEGVFWANFVDAECMARFRRGELDLGGAARVDWGSDGALHLCLSDALADGLSSARQADLDGLRRRIVQSFRGARTY